MNMGSGNLRDEHAATQSATLLVGHHAVAVHLLIVDPALAVERPVDEDGLHGRDGVEGHSFTLPFEASRLGGTEVWTCFWKRGRGATVRRLPDRSKGDHDRTRERLPFRPRISTTTKCHS